MQVVGGLKEAPNREKRNPLTLVMGRKSTLNNPYACRQVSLGTYSSNVATILQLTAGDVIEIYVTISGSTKTADVRNGRASSYFNGYFLGA